MDYSSELKELDECIDNLKKIRDILYAVESTVLEIEDRVCEIDEKTPHLEKMQGYVSKEDRVSYSSLVSKFNEAYALIDEILGPPDDNVTGEPVGTAFSPEAKGSHPGEPDINSLLDQIKSDKRHLS